MKQKWSLFLFAVTFICMASFTVAQTVTTDKPDYESGETVYFNGEGFQAGEIITFAAVGNTNNTQLNFQATADANGAFTTSYVLPNMYEEIFTVNVTGNYGSSYHFIFYDSYDHLAKESTDPVVSCGTTTVNLSFKVKAVKSDGTGEPGVPISFKLNGTQVNTPGQTKTGNDGTVTYNYTFTVASGSYTMEASHSTNSVTWSWTVNCGVAPSITCPGDITVNNATGQCGATVSFTGSNAATATGNPTPSITYNPASGSFFPVGTTTVTATASNIAGSDQCTFEVTVEDKEAPVLNLSSLPDVTSQCSVTLTAPTATDNCDGQVVGVADLTGPFSEGDYTITWTFTDSKGNYSTQTQSVKVHDTQAPIPDNVSLPEVIEQCSVTLTAPTATDNCDGQVVGVADQNGPFTEGEYTITWTFTDSKGNYSTQTQSVKVHDTQAPIPDNVSLPEVIEQCSVTLTAPTATDNCDGQVVGVADKTGPFSEGDYTITWTFTDSKGNYSTQTQSVKVHDTQAPIPDNVSLPEVIEQCSANLPDAPTATDNCDGQVVGVADQNGPFTEGEYTITWTFTDSKGNYSTQTQSVKVHDTQAPIPDNASLPEVIEQCSANLPDAPTATDNCDGQVVGVADKTGPFSEGDYTITWTFTDSKGNYSTQTQSVKVHDTQAPVVTPPADQTFAVCEQVILGSATASDNCDGDLTPANNAPASYNLGTTVVTWSATDNAGNEGKAYQNITITYGALDGFLPPMSGDPDVAIKIKKGRTVPIKFRLLDCPGTSNVIANIYVDQASIGTGTEVDALDAVGTSAADIGTYFRYSASDQQYIFNLNTNNMTVGKTYRIRAILADGQVLYGFISVTK